jgi:hypothetical protein
MDERKVILKWILKKLGRGDLEQVQLVQHTFNGQLL